MTDDEMKVLISESQIKGQMARFAVQQHPYSDPPRLGDVMRQIENACAHKSWDESSLPGFRCKYFEGSGDFAAWLKSTFPDEHEIMKLWNTPANGHTAQHVFTSRYGGPPKEADIIDIGALLWNVARECVQESERNR